MILYSENRSILNTFKCLFRCNIYSIKWQIVLAEVLYVSVVLYILLYKGKFCICNIFLIS